MVYDEPYIADQASAEVHKGHKQHPPAKAARLSCNAK
jgi:hypothetical protein